MKARFLVCLFVVTASIAWAAGSSAEAPSNHVGQRVFTAGHSFHAWLPPWLKEVADSAGIQGHEIVGVSMIGGSKVIQHWDLPDEKNLVKAALRAGKADVLTLSPMWKPDDGIEKFAKLALENNPNIRVTVQEFWLPYDRLRGYGDLEKSLRPWADPPPADPKDLFADSLGHPKPPIQALSAYCHFAIIYHRSPVSLPIPCRLAGKYPEDLNRLLQELAWDAVTHHPLTGVTAR